MASCFLCVLHNPYHLIMSRRARGFGTRSQAEAGFVCPRIPRISTNPDCIRRALFVQWAEARWFSANSANLHESGVRSQGLVRPTACARRAGVEARCLSANPANLRESGVRSQGLVRPTACARRAGRSPVCGGGFAGRQARLPRRETSATREPTRPPYSRRRRKAPARRSSPFAKIRVHSRKIPPPCASQSTCGRR
jgi:hypothetical protein